MYMRVEAWWKDRQREATGILPDHPDLTDVMEVTLVCLRKRKITIFPPFGGVLLLKML